MLPARCLERKLSRAWEQGARSFTECAVCVLWGRARLRLVRVHHPARVQSYFTLHGHLELD